MDLSCGKLFDNFRFSFHLPGALSIPHQQAARESPQRVGALDKSFGSQLNARICLTFRERTSGLQSYAGLTPVPPPSGWTPRYDNPVPFRLYTN
jgi:hypothetical protein